MQDTSCETTTKISTNWLKRVELSESRALASPPAQGSPDVGLILLLSALASRSIHRRTSASRSGCRLGPISTLLFSLFGSSPACIRWYSSSRSKSVPTVLSAKMGARREHISLVEALECVDLCLLLVAVQVAGGDARGGTVVLAPERHDIMGFVLPVRRE